MHPKRISVIVPIYNVEDYLAECLDSILAQDYTNYELLLIDDCSTDRSLDIATSYAKVHRHISCITMKQNSGQSRARNYGLEVACGDYIIFVDSDDLLTDTTAFSQLVKEIEATKADMVLSPAICYNELEGVYVKDDYYHLTTLLQHKSYPLNSTCDLLKDIGLVNVSAWAKIFRLSVIRQHKIVFPEGLKFEDNIFFWHYYLSSNKKFSILDHPHYLYRMVQKNSITGLSSNFDSMATISTMMIDLFKHHYYPEAEKGLTNFVWSSFLIWIKGRNNQNGYYSYFKKHQHLLNNINPSLLDNQSRHNLMELTLAKTSPLVSYFYFNIIHDKKIQQLLGVYKSSKLGRITLIFIKLLMVTTIRSVTLIKGIILLPINLYKYATRPVKAW